MRRPAHPKLRSSDLAPGLKLGRLTLVRKLPRLQGKKQPWECLCSCGNIHVTSADNLIDGTQSCGCLRKETTGARAKVDSFKHGFHDRPEYHAWAAIKQRCLNPDSQAYANYGGRGITMHRAWVDSFEAFYEHVGARPGPGYSIDRIDNSLGYYPGNLRWADRKVQSRNKRTNRKVSYLGKEYTLVELAEVIGIKQPVLIYRLNHGWPESELTRPVAYRSPRKPMPTTPEHPLWPPTAAHPATSEGCASCTAPRPLNPARPRPGRPSTAPSPRTRTSPPTTRRNPTQRPRRARP